MIVPVLCCICLLCLAEAGSTRSRVPRSRRREKLDEILAEGVRENASTEEMLFVAMQELEPSRVRDPEAVRAMAGRVMRRLNSPGFRRRLLK